MSASVRTLVVLPVPPFWERTAIVVAMEGATIARAARPFTLLPSVPTRARSEKARYRRREQVKTRRRYSPTQAYRPLAPPKTVEDHDACALYALVRKDAVASHEPIETALTALETMLHRAGNVDGEGDGCGMMIDIPRRIWAEEVRTGGHASHLALDPSFAVAHVFIPRKGGKVPEAQAKARELMSRAGFRVLAERRDAGDSSAPRATARGGE